MSLKTGLILMEKFIYPQELLLWGVLRNVCDDDMRKSYAIIKTNVIK